jgi:creatinine amidohydrolase
MNESFEVRAEYLSHIEIQSRISESSIVYIPLGALEFHGPHLPTGLDGLTAHGICTRAAGISGGVVLPTIFQGTGGEHSDYPWTLMMPEGQAIASNLYETLNRLEELGVKTTVVLSGHFADEQRELLRQVALGWAEDRSKSMRVTTRSIADNSVAPVAPDHAGVFESLLLAAMHPELVHIEKLPDLDEHPSIDVDGNPFGPQRHQDSHALWGVFGPDPRSIDFDLGPVLLESMVLWLANLAKDLE